MRFSPVKTLSVVTALYSGIVSAQLQPAAALQALHKKGVPVKLYLHTDKPSYNAGETVWYKAYLMQNGLPDMQSNNIYVQLRNKAGKLLLQQKHPVKGAAATGAFTLPDTLTAEVYQLNAFVPAQFNSDPLFLYSKPLPVINGIPVVPPEGKSLALQFFPEGGHLTEDINSTVALYATNENGMPLPISGEIRTDDTVKVASFTTRSDGRGRVLFKPRPGKKYTAVVDFNGQRNYYPLPEVQLSGLSLQVEPESGGKVFTIARTRKDRDAYATVRLMAQMNNRVVYDEAISFDKYFQVKGHLITDSMPSGILQFTLFNATGIPVCERLCFVNNREYLSPAHISVDQPQLDPGGDNTLTVTIASNTQHSLSASITDISDETIAEGGNILSSFLLTSDIRTLVPNAGWYFMPGEDSVKMLALDNLLLSQNWKRFNWQKILAGEFPGNQFDDPYLINLRGQVKDSRTQQPVNGGSLHVFLEPEDSVNQHFEIKVTANGQVLLDSLLVHGRTRLFYNYTTAKGDRKDVKLEMENEPADSIAGLLQPDSVYTAQLHRYYSNMVAFAGQKNNKYVPGTQLAATKELAPVVVRSAAYGRPIDKVNAEYSSGMFTAMGRQNFDNINEPENDRALSVYDFAKRSVRQLMEQDGQFVNRRNFDLFKPVTIEEDFKDQYSRDTARLHKGGSPYGAGEDDAFAIKYKQGKNFIIGIYLNESPVHIGLLKTIRMDEVALIKFYEPGFIGSGATESPGGVLSVYTKKNVTLPEIKPEKLDYIDIKGYARVPAFQSSERPADPDSPTAAGERPTLYWAPELFTSAGNQQISLQFVNTNYRRRYKVVVEGIDVNGRLVYAEKIVEHK